MPMQSAPSGPTKPDAGVMATRPATAPVQMPTTVGLPRIIHSTSIQVNAAAAVAMCVTVMAMPACMPALTAEPALKPNQPTHNSEAPMILLAEFFGPAAHGPLRGLLCARDNASDQAAVADLLLWTWGSPALVRGPGGVRGLLVDCGAAKMPA